MSKDITIKILTHELDYVIDELQERYYKTWFRKKYYKRLFNKLHRYCYPEFKDDLL